MKRIGILQLGGSPVLAGVGTGQRVFRLLLESTGGEPEMPEPLFIDFTGVEVATASFLRESVIAFRDHVRRRRSTLYPVVANANAAVREELFELSRARGGALMVCSLDDAGTAGSPVLIGELEPKQRLAFDEVVQRGETDAGELMRGNMDIDVNHATAWNNRLSGLAALGLVIEVSHGRSKRYRPVITEGS